MASPFTTIEDPEVPIERFLEKWAGTLTMLSLVPATVFVLIAVFAPGRGAGVAFVPALACLLGSLLPVFFLLNRWYPEKPHPSEVPMTSDSKMIRCKREDQQELISSTQYQRIENYIGREVVFQFPKLKGKYEVTIVCPTCRKRITKQVAVRGVRAQELAAGGWYFGCRFPITFTVATFTLGSILQARFGLIHVLGATLSTLILSVTLFMLVQRRLHRNGVSVEFQDDHLSRTSMFHHGWSDFSQASELGAVR